MHDLALHAPRAHLERTGGIALEAVRLSQPFRARITLRRIRCLALAVALGAGLACAATGPASAAPWLFVSDLHVNPRNHSTTPAGAGYDTNPALLSAAIAEMKRVDPHPPVIVLGGDYLAHAFDWPRAADTMRDLARRFGAAFPHAQFVMALGNEDSACGDYALAPRSAFLREVANAWAPLVNRRGAAPSFAAGFARDGFYTTTLPIAHTQAVVIDDVFWSPRYRPCGPAGNPAAATIAELRRALHAPGRHWIILHIPPGIDAYSSAHLAHRLVVVPFLDAGPRDALLGAIADPHAGVALVVAGHTHMFAYRIAGTPAHPVPVLLVPAISPIFRNAPAFLTAEVDPGGTLRDVEDHAFDGTRWHDLGGFDSLGVKGVSGAALVDLQHRLDRDPALRARFAHLYDSGAPSEIDARSWPTYRCAAVVFTASAFRACTDEGGVSVVTTRGILVFALASLALAGAAGALVAYRLGRRRARS
jgi:sphingomyelin phosphodiesterase acid-like 3